MKKGICLIAILIIGFSSIVSASNPIDSSEVKKKKVKNVILLIGDGMGVTQIYAGYTVNKGKLNIERFENIGFSKTHSANNYITDSGAGGTAIATGHKTNNEQIATDTLGMPLKTILEIAEDSFLSTGIVSTSAVTHATPASFIAHNTYRKNYEEIASDFLKTDIEVFIGGGRKHFEERADSVNLIEKLKEKGYHTTTDINEIKELNAEVQKLAGFTAWEHNPPIKDGRGDMLSTGTNKAIGILEKNDNGFFLMVEGSQIDWGGHNNDFEYVVSEVIDFDKVVGEVLDYAIKDGNTLVIVTADHETGGLAIKNGNLEEGKVKASFATTGHTGVMVPVFAFGPGAELFKGFYENTEIFEKIKQLLFPLP